MSLHKHQRVAVIGAGISGVVTAAHLKNSGLDVVVYERSKAAGGIWLFDERKPLEPQYPATLASAGEATYSEVSPDDGSAVEQLLHAPPGPCYVGLMNNVSTPLLETTLNSFPPETPDFVSHSVLRDYIQDTATKTGVDAVTRYNTEVQAVSKEDQKWKIKAATLHPQKTGPMKHEQLDEEFDAVVVASGHYHAPRIPDIPGLANWKRRWSQRVQHSKGYRRPEDYKGKNFLLIGGSVSAVDIARELAPNAGTIYQSHRNGAFDLPAVLLPGNAVRVDEVVAFAENENSTATLADADAIPGTITLKSGHKLCDIHHVILCTGYHITLPYLSHLHADNVPPERADDSILVTDGTQYHNLHKDIFYIPDPSLIFVGVPYFTATFTLFEFQAMVVAQVLSGKVTLPSEKDMRSEYDKRVHEKGFGKAFHSLKEREVEYVNELLAWVNGDLERGGLNKLSGHTETWHEAKARQVERMKALFGGTPPPERQIEVLCY